MPKIPTSPGVLQRPTTEPGFRAPSLAQSQIVPSAIAGLGSDISQIGQIWQEDKRRQQEQYDASQALDFKNQLKDFENKKRIELAQLPNDQDTINNARQRFLEEREEFVDGLSINYEGNRRLEKLVKQQDQNARVNFEFNLDKELLGKQRQFQQDTYYKNITSIKNRYDTAVDAQDFIEIERDLEEEMQAALSLGTIDLKDIDRQQAAFKELRKERQEQIALQESTRQVLTGELLVDTSNKKQTGALDEVYNNAVATGEVDPIVFGEQFATSTGFMPKQFKSFINGQVLGGTPENRVQASLSVVEMLESPKASLLQGQIPNNVQALAYEIHNRNEAGLSPSDSVKFATEELEKNKSLDRKLRIGKFETEFGSGPSKKAFQEGIESIADELKDDSGFLFFEAEAPDEMALQVRTLAKDLYLNEGMTLDAAMDKAKRDVVAEWDITDIGERRYQRFAPERFYPIPSKEIRTQALNAVEKRTGAKDKSLKSDIRLQVIPDSIATSFPAYIVQRELETGAIEPVLGSDNLPILFRPDVTKSKAYQEQQEARDPLSKEEFEKKRRPKRKRAAFKQKFGTTDMRTLNLIGVPPK